MREVECPVFYQKRKFIREIQKGSRGFTLLETVLGISVALIGLLGAYGLTVVIGKHQRSSNSTAAIYRESRTAIERMFKEISETSDTTITIGDNAISFASARDENGDFQLRPYSGIFMSDRPDWQKAIIYYKLENSRRLIRTSVPKTNWSTNYEALESGQLQELSGRVMAKNIDSMSFEPVYTGPSARYSMLNATLQFSAVREGEQQETDPGEAVIQVGAGAIPEGVLSTRIPIMNRE